MDSRNFEIWQVEALDESQARVVEGGRSLCPFPPFEFTLPVEPIVILLPPVTGTFRSLV